MFSQVVKEVHRDIDITDFETALGTKLLRRTLDKVEVAQLMANRLVSDAVKSIPPITIDPSDPAIGYLIDAIKYACGR